MGDGFYRSKDPTNSIKVLKEESNSGRQRVESATKMPLSVFTRGLLLSVSHSFWPYIFSCFFCQLPFCVYLKWL